MKIYRDLLNVHAHFTLKLRDKKHSSMRLERKLSNFLFKYPFAQTYYYASMWTNWLTVLLNRA